MSGNRANASAINRRTNGATSVPQQQQQPSRQPVQRPGQGQQRLSSGAPQQQQQQQQQLNKQKPQISVSDAIALTTLRLGRVENFINSLPPLDQIGNSNYAKNDNDSENNSESINENMRIVDEAVFTSIVSRLEKLEQTNLLSQTQTQTYNQKTQGNINIISKSIESIKHELADLKEMFTKLQTFVIETTTTATASNSDSESGVNNTDNTDNTDNVDNVDDINKETNEELNEIITSDLKQTIEQEISSSL